MNKIEVLAPAGSMESLYAAINNGADAIYLGGNKFSARAYASNFDNENMKKAIDYAHSYGVKVYVTMNTLLKEEELQKALKYAGYLYEIGVDALIIQDLGLVKLIKEKYSDFELHASTQMTIHNGEGALYFKERGFHRIVLSRELTFEEIKHISKDLKIETEIFVHGALCVCYSGQCLMSSMIGGRSGNRGRCAQPCRMEYTLKSRKSGEKRGYLLSPKDMCTIEDVKDIINSGTYSLKIEGRMKRPEYVAGVVRNYRKAVDKELFHEKFDVKIGKDELLQLFNREGFSKAYLKKDVGRDMMSYNFPKNTGVILGKVLENGEVILERDISLGDGIRVNDGGFTLSKIIKNKNEIKEAKKGDKVKLFPIDYKKGDFLYKMSDKKLTLELSETVKPYGRKIELEGYVTFKVNEKLKLGALFNDNYYEVSGKIVEEATNRPLDKERIEKALFKSGDYPYKFNKINFIDFDNGFIRIGDLNELRRALFEKIVKGECSKYRRNRYGKEVEVKNISKEIKAIDVLPKVILKDQFNELKKDFEYIAVDIFSRYKNSIKIDDLKEYSKTNKLILKLPNIIKSEFSSVVNIIEKVKPYICGILTSNVGIINKYKNELKIIGDYKLNIFNSEALNFFKEDLDIITVSEELNRKEIKALLKSSKYNCAKMIYGKTELMVSEYCPIGSTFGLKDTNKSCNRACEKDIYTLIDRVNEKFSIMTDVFCRSYILNSLPLNLIEEIDDLKDMGINCLRLDFTDETIDEVRKVINEFNNKKVIDVKDYTKGHYRRGVE